MEQFVTHAPTIGLLFFFVVFVSIVVSVLRPGAKKKLETYAQIPLKEERND